MPRILITGCSSGFGRETALRFLNEGWEVVATMRRPDAADLPQDDRLQSLALDVTDADSIREAVTAAGPVDALVNNAGVGMLNVLEGVDMAKARELFETNILGAMAVTQAVLPEMRARRAGVIVNVSSSVTLRPLPALSVYSASKAAMNAFTGSLALELADFGIRARLVLPGSAPTTPFGQNAMARWGLDVPAPYADFVETCLGALRAPGEKTLAADVAGAVWRSVTDPDAPMVLPAGADAETWYREAQGAAA